MVISPLSKQARANLKRSGMLDKEGLSLKTVLTSAFQKERVCASSPKGLKRCDFNLTVQSPYIVECWLLTKRHY
jgi:hypothetical protein